MHWKAFIAGLTAGIELTRDSVEWLNALPKRVETHGQLTYIILREGIPSVGDEVLVNDLESEYYQSRWLRWSGFTRDFEYDGGARSISHFVVIAQDIENEHITAEVVAGGVGGSHVKIRLSCHEGGLWRYRVLVFGN